MPEHGGEKLHLSVGVTAHRDLVPAEVEGVERRVEAFFRNLQRAFPDLPLQLLTPLAAGGDQLAARVALRLGIPIVAVLPMSQAEYEQDFRENGDLSEFRGLLRAAVRVIELPSAGGEGEARFQGRARQLQYAQLGIFLSNHCQVLLALWDGREGTKLGGTGQVVRYHLTAVMPGFDSDLTAAELLADNENDLVFHVVCSRDREAGAPAEGLAPLDTAWFSSRDDGARSAELPAAYRQLLERLQRFARDWRDKEDVVARNGENLMADAPQFRQPSGAGVTNRLFQVADGLAVHYQQRVHGSLRAMHVLAVLMGLVFLVYTEYEAPDYMALVFLVLFFAGVVLYLVGNSREWHRKYLDYRALAEGLRVQLYWNLAGVVDTTSAGFAYDNFLQQQDVDLGWIRHVMRRASLYRRRGEQPHPNWVGWVIDDWVGAAGSNRGQLTYYTRKEQENAARYRRTSRLGNLALWVGISIAGLLYFIGEYRDSPIWHLLLILMGALPLVAGIWDAYSHKRAEKELIKQYGFMGGVFEKARRLLDGSGDIAFQRQVLKALGQAALEEGAEWLLIHRERPLEHGRL